MCGARQRSLSFPTLPLAQIPSRSPTIALSHLEAIADYHARLIWGEDCARGEPIPMSNSRGELIAYAFPYARDVKRFPNYAELFDRLHAIRQAHRLHERALMDFTPEFFRDVELDIGRFGVVYVSATRDHFPVLRTSFHLHPYFLSGEDALAAATERLGGAPILEKYYLLGTHREYFGFALGSKRALLKAESLQYSEPEEELEREPEISAPPEARAKIEEAWKALDAVIGGLNPGTLPVTRMISKPDLMPVVNWTYWCAPTALSMVIGYWDNYVRGRGTTLGFGRLTDYWLYHQPSGHNVPNLLTKLIDPDTGTWAGTVPEVIRDSSGYHFAYESKAGTAENDWAWADIVAEIDEGRPVHWEAFNDLAAGQGHALAAFGYRLMPTGKFVLVHTTWGVTEEAQHEEWHYAQFHNGAPVTRTGVNRVRPLDTPTGNGIAIIRPETSLFTIAAIPEPVCQWIPVDIQFEVSGEQIQRVDVLSSGDGGNTWALIASDLPATRGVNSYVWLPAHPTGQARVRVVGRDATGSYVAGDGSHHDFPVLGGDVLQITGRVKMLRVLEAITPDWNGIAVGPGALVLIESSPDMQLFLRLRAGSVSPPERASLELIIDALEANSVVHLDVVQVNPHRGLIFRVAQ